MKQAIFYHKGEKVARRKKMILCSKTLVRLSATLWFFFGIIVSLSAQIFPPPPWLVPYLDDAPEIVSRAAVLIDAQTGTILYAKNPDEEIPPASLAKLMTMHLVMKAIKEGRASYDEIIPITVDSWAQSQPYRSSLMFLEPGQRVTLREILLGLSVSSGNDAAVAAALRLAPSMRDFGVMMNEEAKRLGLYITRFDEASGISVYNKTTAAEFASFCRQYIIMHPQSLVDFHSVQEFSYPLEENVLERRRNNPRTITQFNNNSLLRTFPGVDGLKTGFINESGFNIALTAQRDQTRFILVLLGAPSGRGGSRIRASDSTRLLSWAFENFKTVRLEFGILEERLWKGKSNIALIAGTEPDVFTVHSNREGPIRGLIEIPKPIIAPLAAGEKVGYRIVFDDIGELYRTPLVTIEAYERGNVFKRFWHSIQLLFRKS